MVWEDDHRGHELWNSVTSTLEDLAEVTADEHTNELLRLRALLTEISGHSDQPHAALTTAHLTKVKGIVDGISAKLPDSLAQVFAPPQNNRNAPSLFSQLAQHVRSWPATGTTRLIGLGSRAEEVEAAFKTLNDRLDERLSEVEALANEQAERMNAAREQQQIALAEQRAAFETLIEDKTTTLQQELEELREAVGDTDTAIEQQKKRLDAILSDQHEKFSMAQEDRAKEWSSLLADNDAKLQEHMATMQEHQKRSQNVLSAVGVNATATDYGAYANAQAEAANRWRIGAVIALSVAALAFLGAAGASLFGFGTNLDWWQVIFQKLGAPVGAAAVGYVLIRESGQHRKEERSARQVQLTLTALEPFIANLPEKQKEQIRADTARRIFAERPGEPRRTAMDTRNESDDTKTS